MELVANTHDRRLISILHEITAHRLSHHTNSDESNLCILRVHFSRGTANSNKKLSFLPFHSISNKHSTHPNTRLRPLVPSLASLPRGLRIAHSLIHGPSPIELLSLGRIFAPRLPPSLPSVQALSMHPQNFSASSSQG